MMPRFGRANLLGVFALFDDDPGRINTILDELEKVTVDDVKAAAARWLVPDQPHVDRQPAGSRSRRREVAGDPPDASTLRSAWRSRPCSRPRVAAQAQALPKPEVGPEKPFAPPPRVERTLPNGLRVIAVRYGTRPEAVGHPHREGGAGRRSRRTRPASHSWSPKRRRKAPPRGPASS